ncbi:terpenoid synthase [Pyrrhoderma noxium]|uniref:(2E,6E)-farnesyl diphosphate synthase n=1 Tax=Pyrrhoderma noxium TaxID=2282107 RepID=A0A286UU19_9AGAM|nr:terpenoid synthase [Pyrrhoderma noxium]
MLEKLSNTPQWTRENEQALTEPFSYITANPGKEIRGRMIQAFNEWLKVPQENVAIIGKVVNMLHSSSLLIDDIEDDSQLRRGEPVAHKIYGVPQTINCANYVFFQAFKELLKLRGSWTSDVDAMVTEELLNLHRGQGLELLWRDSLQCPSEEEYIDMVNNKTGGLFRIAIKLMMTCATENRDIDYVPLVNLIGVYFQIRDDYLNLQSREYESNKGFAEDLTEGKFSFPVVHGIRADISNRQILNVLQKRPTTPTLKHFTINYLRNHTKSFDYTLRVLEVLEGQIRSEVVRLGGNPGLEKIIDTLSTRGLHIEKTPDIIREE